MLVLLFVALWFILRGDLLYVFPCVILFLCFFSPFSIAITSLGEERANLSAFRTYVRFVLVWICRIPLPVGVWEGLRFVIVALPGLFSYLFLVQNTSSVIKLAIAVFSLYLYECLGNRHEKETSGPWTRLSVDATAYCRCHATCFQYCHSN